MTNNYLLAEFTANQIFAFCSQLAMLGWLILILLPRGLKLINFIPLYLIPFTISSIYSVLIFKTFFTVDGGFSSLTDVRLLFQNDGALLAGWVHYLAFDLFIGGWIAKKCDELKISRIIQTPILIATFMLGPIGLALFLMIRSTTRLVEEPQNA
ncbi:ABA4-like family protein [Kangiella sp. HZ709]|uniref:ABA4-like family protein n=1 Tax=Kangiella sp. HZ709 TaxID=2666328 RepID=UPI0012AF2F02|nr:ABA4-like family protein [Kangiella sp. HZ709]MRX27443.1 DUF4281 domain-containing protein [Kangiella sp. HZ709]